MNKTTTIDPALTPQPVLHEYLLSAVAPRPICFASTINATGEVNLSPFSFFNVFSSNPPILIFSPARRGRDNTTKHTYENVLEVKEVVINIVNYAMVEQMSLASTDYPKGVNEFVKSGLTQVASERVSPPRVGEAPVAFECAVEQVIPLGNEGGAGNLVIAKVLLVHIQNAFLTQNGSLDTTKLDLVARMGANWYCRANGDALFEIRKPLRTQGIGVDQLPKKAQNSSVLTGNHLGRLGNLASLPSLIQIEEIVKEEQVQKLVKSFTEPMQNLQIQIHKLAAKWLDAGEPERALCLLMWSENL